MGCTESTYTDNVQEELALAIICCCNSDYLLINSDYLLINRDYLLFSTTKIWDGGRYQIRVFLKIFKIYSNRSSQYRIGEIFPTCSGSRGGAKLKSPIESRKVSCT